MGFHTEFFLKYWIIYAQFQLMWIKANVGDDFGKAA
jgi:hypothetical protein